MAFSSFSSDEVAALTQGTSFFVAPGERDCPSCGSRRLRTYVHAAPSARRPTLVSYVWCAGCSHFVGTRSRLPDGLEFTDPLSDAARRDLSLTLGGFLAHLDALWDSGALPQSFSVAAS